MVNQLLVPQVQDIQHPGLNPPLLTDHVSLFGTRDKLKVWHDLVRNKGARLYLTFGWTDPAPEQVQSDYASGMEFIGDKRELWHSKPHGYKPARQGIVQMENCFGTNMSGNDVDRLYLTKHTSHALKLIFHLYGPETEILVQHPGWGPLFDMDKSGGAKPVACEFFSEGRFKPEVLEAGITGRTGAVYVNMPSNPTMVIPSEEEVVRFTRFCRQRDLQIISDEIFKYLIHDGSFTSPMNLKDASDDVSVVSSFSKTIGNNTRTGFVRIAPNLLAKAGQERVSKLHHDLECGCTPLDEAGIYAVLLNNPSLGFLGPMKQAYREKLQIAEDFFARQGCDVPNRPQAGFSLFLKAPNGLGGEEYALTLAEDHGIGVLPGSCFAKDRQYEQYFRASVGGGITPAELRAALGRT